MVNNAIQKYLNTYSFEHIRLKAVLFDMDGVLFDSMHIHAKAWLAALQHHGLQSTLEEVYENEGRTGKSTINLLAKQQWHREVSDEEAAEIYETKSKFFNQHPEATRMDGALELLEELRYQGIQIILVTGSGQKSLLHRLNTNFPDIFHHDTMVTSFDVHHGKPNPEPYLQGLHKAGIQPWEAVVVENAPLGIRAGVAAKIFTIALNTGPLPDKRLLDEGANLLFPSMKEFQRQWHDLQSFLT